MGMSWAIVGVAFAAVCVWLTVRIVNRRERWAKWTALGVICLPLLYVMSLGPVCALVGRGALPASILKIAFRPCLDLAIEGPEIVHSAIWAWAKVCGGEYPLFSATTERSDELGMGWKE
jgi:hypothetical protein